jgi:hypothetical protein
MAVTYAAKAVFIGLESVLCIEQIASDNSILEKLLGRG